MTQNVLQVASDADQPAQDGTGAASTQDARALLDHLHSALAVKAEGHAPSADSLPPVVEQAGREAPSFGRAVAKQADQIQYLIEQINRLDNDTQFAELRDVVRGLYGALNDVVLRMKQNASEVTAKIGLLTGAVTIISGAPNLDAPQDVAAILNGAIAAAERMMSLERLLKEAGAAIVALEERASRGQHAVQDLSADLAKLNAQAESDRNAITGLHQRLESTDQSLAQGLANVRETIDAGHNEIARLHQRLESTDQSLAQGLANVRETIEAGYNEIARLHQRLESTDQSLAQGLANVRETIEAGYNEIARLHQRLESTDQSLAQGLARVGDAIESDRNEIARLHQRIVSTDQASTQGLTTLGERAAALHDALGRMHERLGSVENSTALHAGFGEKIEVLNRRLEETQHNTAAEINSARLQDSERFAALMNRLEALEQKNQVLNQDTEQMAARLQAAEQTIATMAQSQKALSTWHDRITHVLLASPELPAV